MRSRFSAARFVVALLVSSLFCSFSFAAPPAELPPMTIGRVSVSWNPGRGLLLKVDGVPVARQSTLYIVKKGWTGTLLDQRDADWKSSGWQRGADGAQTAQLTAENASARFAYTLTLTKAGPGETFTVDLAYRLKEGVAPAEFEYAATYWSGTILQGALLRRPDPNGDELREISFVPPPAGKSQLENRLSPPFREIELKTRLGGIGIVFEGDAPAPVLFDARSEAQDWASAFPIFWMGIGSPAVPITAADGERHARFRFTLTPPTNGANGAKMTPGVPQIVARGPILPDAYTPKPPLKPLIIPNPKRISFPTDVAPFRLNAATRILRADATPGTSRAATVLQRALKESFALNLPIVSLNAKALSNVVVVGVSGKSAAFAPGVVTVPAKPEGYSVRVTKNAIFIAGRDEAGALWGAQTVVQLFAADAKGPLIRSAVVEDWPTLSLRGVHLFHGRNALPFHEKLLDRIFSRFKMNALFIEADHLRWDTVGDAAPKWGGTKADVRTEIAYARERGVTMYPLVQGYGHMELLFGATKNKEFAEDPNDPWAVNFTDPKAVAYITKLLIEADALFAAPAFHVGMDEVTLRGRFPYRSRPKTTPELLGIAATHWRNVFAKRGKPVYMWADMLMEPSEVRPSWGTMKSVSDAKAARALVPKDITLIDWQYGTQERFPSLRFLKNAGFKNVLAATWFQPENIQNVSRAAADAGANGVIQTTWCGYESNESILDGPERRQFTAMVLAAEYFWNGGASPAPDKLPYDAGEIFTAAYRGPDSGASHVRAGYVLRLDETANRTLSDWLGYGVEQSPLDLPEDARFADGTLYHIGKGPILLAGKLNPPGDYPLLVELPRLSADFVKEVRLLMTATHRADPGAVLGSVTLTHTDGTTQQISLLYGKNSAAWDDPISATDAPILWKGVTGASRPFVLRGLTLRPAPGKRLASVRIQSANGESAPCIFGVTALTE